MDTTPRFRFAFVSNSAEIAATVKASIDPLREILEVRLATMEEALPVARELLDQGVEVVLGGGATGRLLRSALRHPVVTIARSHLDVLNALLLAKRFGTRVGLTSFAAPLEGRELIESLLQVEIRELVFTGTSELVDGLARLAGEGAQCIVGSGVCKEIASSLGLPGIVVYPGREVIVRALEEARAIAASQREERRNAERLHTVLETISEGVIGIDGQGRVSLLNRTAAEKLGLDPAQVIGRPLPESLGESGLLQALRSGQTEMDQIRRLAGNNVVVSTQPVLLDGRVQSAVSSFKLVSRIENIERKLKEKRYAKGFVARYTFAHLRGQSPAMVRLRARAADYAATDAAILLQGETGCGKEILAQGIHNASPRRSRPFVAVNCSALPGSLLESELFGYEEGAFTGARRGGKPGLFELASEGGIFLDEIADISPQLQVRLLRVLEEKEVMRIGGDRIIPVDVRIVSSASRDLVQEVRAGRFRSDLYFRLAVLRLDLPALRQRPEDIPEIMEELLVRNGLARERATALLAPAVTGRLAAYAWPGNVRELDSLVRRFLALGGGDHPRPQELLRELLDEVEQAGLGRDPVESDVEFPADGTLRERVEAFEQETIRRVLAESRHSRREAARRLGVSVNTLWRKFKS